MSFLTKVEHDVEAAYEKVTAGLVYLEHEGKVIVAWIDKEVPGAAGAMSAFLVEAEEAAANLAKHAAAGLNVEVGAAGDSVQTWLANLIQSTHIGGAAGGNLKAIDVAAVRLLETIATNTVKVGLAQLLAKLAGAAIAAV